MERIIREQVEGEIRRLQVYLLGEKKEDKKAKIIEQIAERQGKLVGDKYEVVEERAVYDERILKVDIWLEEFRKVEKERLKEGCTKKTEKYTETEWLTRTLIFQRGDKVKIRTEPSEDGAISYLYQVDENGQVTKEVKVYPERDLENLVYTEPELARDILELKDIAQLLSEKIGEMGDKYCAKYNDGSRMMLEMVNDILYRLLGTFGGVYDIRGSKEVPQERMFKGVEE